MATTRADKLNVCDIHGTELVETRPADPESGPSPSDCFNELVCAECESELAHAPADCLAHRRPADTCEACFYDELDAGKVAA